MRAVVSTLLRQSMPPAAYRRVRAGWWCASFYVPRIAAAGFARKNPEVHAYPGEGELARQLRQVNVLAPTEMCRVMTWHGSDKGAGRHNYTTVYSALFRRWRGQPLRIFELGLGTNNPALQSTMGVNGRPGASLRAWRQLFPRAQVFGADIDRDILFKEERIKTFYCDQLDGRTICDLWSQPALRDGMDIIIDDGLHTFEANASFLGRSLEHLRPGGVYAVEDIHRDSIAQWLRRLETTSSRLLAFCQFALVQLPAPANLDDNNLLVIRKNVS